MTTGNIVQAEAEELLGPAVSGANQGTATAITAGAAQSLDTGVTRGGVWVTLQARGGAVYVRFGATATTATTNGNSSNGVQIAAGSSMHFYVPPGKRYMDVNADANCTLFWWKSSRNIIAGT